jgi:hypothetical protein
MSITTIFTGIVIIAAAIPKTTDLINKFYNLWIDHQVNKLEKNNTNIKNQRIALMNAIKNAKTENEIKALSVILANLK